MAAGVPVVASDIPGHTDLITDDYNGALFEADLPGPLAGALRIVLADADVRDTFSAAGLKTVSGYTIDRMAKKTAEVYREVACADGYTPEVSSADEDPDESRRDDSQ
jgi:phosphatidylinositol alpha-mannosyltransferase